MPKPLNPIVAEALSYYNFPQDAVWDCHGTWVAKHWALEQLAVHKKITLQPPHIIEADGLHKIATVLVVGECGDKTEWSIGEAAPYNYNVNEKLPTIYPWAMAEKRAKDRVILKLLGWSGLVYSEEEADEFKPLPPAKPLATAHTKKDGEVAVTKVKATIKEITDNLKLCEDHGMFMDYMLLLQEDDRAKLIDCAGNEWWHGKDDAKGLRKTITLKARSFDDVEPGTSSQVENFLDHIEVEAKEQRSMAA